jgi:hypothetical protein
MEYNTVRTHQLGHSSRSGAGISEEGRQGRLDGTSLRIRSNEDDIDEKIQAEQLARSAGLLMSREPKNISQFKLSTQSIPTDLGLLQARRLEKSFSSEKQTADTAQELLRNMLEERPLPKQGNSPSEVAERFASLMRLREALSGDDEKFIAFMSPLPEGISDLKAFSKKLQNAGDDDQALKQLFSDIRGFQDEEALVKSMRAARFDQERLKEQLRNAQSLPYLDKSTREELGEKVQDEISELLRRDESHVRAINAVLEKAGEGTTTAAILSYDELVHSGWTSFVSMLEILISRHPPKELSQNVMPLMEQALAHELGRGEEQRSVDKPKLEAVMNWLQCLRIAKGLFPSLERLITSIKRMYGVT